jgi:hypothetical protein
VVGPRPQQTDSEADQAVPQRSGAKMMARPNKSNKSMPDLLARLQQTGSQTRIMDDLNELVEQRLVRMDHDRKPFSFPQSARSTFLMVFSPNGQRIASTHGDHKIYISDVNTAKVTQTLGKY